MEKVFIKPTAKEIMLKGNGKDGPSDLFSYDYADPSQRSLGHLYVVGNIQPGQAAAADDIDVGYVINLVASLAKREYYSRHDAEPKDAFSAALKKINGVIEEFFKEKDTKINIGLFTIASGQLHIAKLGKFKILLARDGSNIDILNNVDLFKKEVTQEKQFSNIISGNVVDGDKIFAFYPSRVMIAREKQLKVSLLDLGQEDFTKKIESIKNDKEDFACAAVHIELHKSKEPATEPKIQPKELQEEIVEEKPEITETTPMPAPVQLAAKEEEPVQEKVKINSHTPVKQIEVQEEIPRIIPAEFSLGRKSNPFAKYGKMARNLRVTPKNRAYVMGGALVVVLAAVFVLKSYVFVSASSKALNNSITQASDNIKEAQSKVSQNDLVGAHAILVSSLASLDSSIQENGSSTKATDTKNNIVKALDSLEQASDASLSSLAAIPTDSGKAVLIATSGNDLYTYMSHEDSGTVSRVSQDSVSHGVEMKNVSPVALFGSENYISALDLADKKVSSLSLTKSSVGSINFNDALVSADIYQGNLYGLTASGIIKITDAALGHNDVKQWLTSGSLANDSALIAVDGNIFVLTKSGVLTEYYKGEKKNEFATPIVADDNSLMLTTTDSPSLYVINKALGRIYIISKDSGSLTKTLKLNTDTPIVSAALADDGTVYILQNNTVWKVQ